MKCKRCKIDMNDYTDVVFVRYEAVESLYSGNGVPCGAETLCKDCTKELNEWATAKPVPNTDKIACEKCGSVKKNTDWNRIRHRGITYMDEGFKHIDVCPTCMMKFYYWLGSCPKRKNATDSPEKV